jgi:hypothetical protein
MQEQDFCHKVSPDSFLAQFLADGLDGFKACVRERDESLQSKF